MCSRRREEPAVRNRPLLSFFILTFAITWGLGACYVLFPEQLVSLFGPMSNHNPLFYLAVYAPSFSGILLTVYLDGLPGLRDLLSRLFRWRVDLRWYLIVLLGVPALLLASAVLTDWLSGEPLKLLRVHWQLALWPMLTALVLDPGPLGEEFGWRGFALPRLLQVRSPLSASLILGLIWGVWHLPAFFIQGLPQNQFGLPAFLIGCLALSVLITWIYQQTRGSLLFAVLIHWLFNTPYVPRGSFPAVSALLTLAALFVVGSNWRTWLSRGSQIEQAEFAPSSHAAI
jgi:membrane protease YdiL (CAAX protease family)